MVTDTHTGCMLGQAVNAVRLWSETSGRNEKRRCSDWDYVKRTEDWTVVNGNWMACLLDHLELTEHIGSLLRAEIGIWCLCSSAARQPYLMCVLCLLLKSKDFLNDAFWKVAQYVSNILTWKDIFLFFSDWLWLCVWVGGCVGVRVLPSGVQGFFQSRWRT